MMGPKRNGKEIIALMKRILVWLKYHTMFPLFANKEI
jgi:hypothetical protein